MAEDERSGRAFSVKRDIVARDGLADISSGIVDPEPPKGYNVRAVEPR
ncbi:MAG: hypothetical protein ACLP5H_09340 [Desulfomonilaceae bacterium]